MPANNILEQIRNQAIAENFSKDRGINSLTNNIVTNNKASNTASDDSDGLLASPSTSSPSGKDSRRGSSQEKRVSVIAAQVTGIAAQKRKTDKIKGRPVFHVSFQLLSNTRPVKHTFNCLPPDRRREYVQATEVQQQLFEDTKRTKLWLCNIHPRGKKSEYLGNYVAYYDFDTTTLYIKWDDRTFEIVIDQTPTPAQVNAGYDVMGIWGTGLQGKKRKIVTFEETMEVEDDE